MERPSSIDQNRIQESKEVNWKQAHYYSIKSGLCFWFLVDVEDRFHVGDAPMDMMAAKQAGVKGIGVTTGVYSKQTLLDAGASIVLEGLHNLEQVLDALQLN